MSHKIFKPEYLKAQMRLAEAVSVAFAFGLAEKDGKDVFVMSYEMEPPELFAKIKSEAGLTKGTHGTVKVANKALVLSPTKPLPPLRKRLTELAKAEGWLVKKVRIEGQPEVDDTPQSTSEVISGASAQQLSTGALTETTADLGEDFGKGARENAFLNITGDQGKSGPHGSTPMQSPRTSKQRTFAKRYGLGFLCWDYLPRFLPDLVEIKDYKKPNSAYLKAFKGMDKTHQVDNPTAPEMQAAITRWAQELAGDLISNDGEERWGELVISFQGHGGGGRVYGVDGSTLSPSQMVKLADFAESKRVSLTFVLDGCFTGRAVPAFQQRVADEVDTVLAAAEANDAGGKVAVWKEQLALARRLIKYNHALGAFSDTVQAEYRGLKRSKGGESRSHATERAAKVVKDAILFLTSMVELLAPDLDKPLPGGADLQALASVFAKKIKLSKGFIPATPAEFDNWVAELGDLQDHVSDTANLTLEGLDLEARAAAKA